MTIWLVHKECRKEDYSAVSGASDYLTSCAWTTKFLRCRPYRIKWAEQSWLKMPPAAQVEGPGAYNSCPGKERARDLGRVAAAAPARTSSTEEALPAAVGRDHMRLPSSSVAATTATSTSLCALPAIPEFSQRQRQQDCQGSGFPQWAALPGEAAAPDFLPSSANIWFAYV